MSATWIERAIPASHAGALHRDLGIPVGETIPAATLDAATQSTDPKEAARARLAETLKRMRK